VQVTDACTSSGIADDVGEGDAFDSEAEAGDFGGQPELPGECDMVVKVPSAPLSATVHFKRRCNLLLQASAVSAMRQRPCRDVPHYSLPLDSAAG
jgi:hypothetical protein